MPNATADALARILSLSSSDTDDVPCAGPKACASTSPAPHNEDDHNDQMLFASLFYEINDESSEFDGSRHRCSSGLSLADCCHDHVLDVHHSSDAHPEFYEDAAPWNAHGPDAYGSPHQDPYGPASPAECGSPPHAPDMDSKSLDGDALSFPRNDASAAARNSHENAPSQMDSMMPEWAYDALPRDCLIMLLTSALQHMPHETSVVARCMRALAPLTPEEYRTCFAKLPQELCAVSSSSTAARPPLMPESAPAFTARPFPIAAPQPPKASSASYSSSLLHVKYPTVAPFYWPESSVHKQGGGHSTPLHGARQQSPPASGNGRRSWSPSSPTLTVATSSCEVRRTINKAGTRTSILLTDSRSGTRTSVLTEEQAIEVFKQRPADRSERATVCSELAERYSITPTAIRHIWARRTWVWTNIPYWTQEEMAASLAEGTCEACRCKALASNKIQDTCELCPINRKRGRPRGAKDSSRRQRN